jgi:hypothetical protein
MNPENVVTGKTRRSLLIYIGSAGLVGAAGFILGKQAGEAQRTPITIEPASFVVPASYIIFKDGNYVKARNGQTGQIEYSNSDASKVVNYALSKLTPNRTSKEVVALVGSFTLSDSIRIPSYTVLDLRNAFIRLGDNVNKEAIQNSDIMNGNTDIEIVGGVIDGNSKNNMYGNAIIMYNASRFIIRDVTVVNTFTDGIRVRQSSNGIISNVVLRNIKAHGIFICYGSSHITVSDVVAEEIQLEPLTVEIFQDSTPNRYIVVENLVSRNNYNYGMFIGQAEHVTVNNVAIYNTVSSMPGLKVTQSSHVTVSNAIISLGSKTAWRTCITLDSSTGVIIANSIFTGPGDTDIGLSISASASETQVIGCRFYNFRKGAEIRGNAARLIGNVFSQCAKQGYTSIHVRGAGSGTCRRVLLQGNIVLETTPTPNWAMAITDLPSDAEVEVYDNCINVPVNYGKIHFTNNDPIARILIRRNLGYKSESSGVSTIPAGSTSVTVNHGLAMTPSKVLITPLAQPPGKLWVENITSTSFNIATDTAPTTSLNVAWYVEV